MARFVVAIVAFGCLSIGAAPAEAQRATEQKMAEEALKPFVPSDELQRVAHIHLMREKVNSRSNLQPNQVGSVAVVFTSGKTVSEVGEIASSYKLEISRINMKVPQGDQGVVLSMSIASDDLVKREGDFQSRARKAIGVLRYDMVQMAENFPTDEKEMWMESMHQPFLIYSVEAIGKFSRLRKFLDRSDVAIVVAHDGEGRSLLHEHLKEKYREARERRNEGANQ